MATPVLGAIENVSLIMTELDDINGMATEYVLGTHNAAERAQVAARRMREPALEAAIVEWETLLAPLNELVAGVAPPTGLYEQIIKRLSGLGSSSVGGRLGADVIDVTRRMKRWRAGALIASALAASLAMAIGVDKFTPRPPSKDLVAVLQKDAASPAFLVTVNVDTKLMTVRPVAAKHEPGKSYELWIIQDSLGAPKSLGVIDESGPMMRPTLASYKSDVIESATLAVSLEPEGGSKTGAPTGPVVFAGKMIEASK